MNEASKQIFWLDEMQLKQYGWNNAIEYDINSKQKSFNGYAFTMMMWYRQKTFTAHNGIVGIRTGTSGNLNAFTMGIETTGEFTGCQQRVSNVNTGYKIVADTWHHLCFTRDATCTQIKAYVNGNLVHSGTYGAQTGFPDTIIFPNTAACAATCAKIQLNDIEFSAEEVMADFNNIHMIQHKDTLRALYTEVKDGVLVDMCGTYNISMPDAVVDMGKFTL